MYLNKIELILSKNNYKIKYVEILIKLGNPQ